LFRNVHDTKPVVRTFTWQQLKDGWSKTRRTPTKEARNQEVGLMSPATFDPPQRKQENVVEVSVLILDVDIGVTAEDVLDRLRGYDVFLVETFNSKPDALRWRVLVRLVSPIPGADYNEAWARVNQLMQGWLDPATKDSSRMMWLTCAPPNAPDRRFFAQEGDALDWRELPAVREKKKKTRTGSVTPGRFEDRRAAGMLAKWVNELSEQVPGSRRARLMQVAEAAGGLVANGLLDAQNARQSLLAACDVNGLTMSPRDGGDGEEATERALEDALHHGEGSPWWPADFGDSKDYRPDSSPRLGQRRNGHHRVTREIPDEIEDVEPEPLPEIPEFPIDVLSPIWGQLASTTSLPMAYSVGAGLGIACAAIGSESEVELPSDPDKLSARSRHQRAVLWIPLVGPGGTGKNGAIERVAAVMDRHFQNDRGLASPTLPMPLVIDASTMPALMVNLHQMQEEVGSAALAIVSGEMSALLTSLGEYQHAGNSSDRSKFLDLFSADRPMTYQRRGANAGRKNKIDLYIERPTVPVLGGLVPENTHLLGPIHGDGMRSRWLPFLARDPGPDVVERDDWDSSAWDERIRTLLSLRAQRRVWVIRGDARELFNTILAKWRAEAYLPGQSDTVRTLFLRGSTHLARVALVLVEFEHPCQNDGVREIPAWIVKAAGAVVRYSVNCWHALGEDGSAGLTIMDDRINRLLRTKLIPTLEALRHGEGRISKRDLQRRRIIDRDPKIFQAVMAAYEAQYGAQVVRREGVGGQAPTWVYPPPRGSS